MRQQRRLPGKGPFALAALMIAITSAVAAGGIPEGWRSNVVLLAALGLAVGWLVAWRVWGTVRRQLTDLESVYGFTAEVDDAVTTETLVEATLRTCRDLFDADLVEVIAQRGVGSTLSYLSASAATPSRRPAPPELLDGISSVDEAHVAALSDAPEPIVRHYGARTVSSGMVATVPGGSGSATMVMVGQAEAPSDDDLRLFGLVVRQAHVAFERVRLVERLRREINQKEHQVLHDALTGLPNRLHFSIAVEEALRRVGDGATTVAVLLIDLDRFKEINDTLGHQRGDVVLREVALRLSELTGGEHLARLGGDEFGVVLRSVDGVAGAVEEARRFGAAVRKPLVSDDLTLQVNASIGIAIAPEHGSDGNTLLRRAEVAMYDAKETVSNIEVYDAQRDRYSTRRLALASEMGQAITSGAISVHYQPKVRLSDGGLAGVEALARWHHPRLGDIPPTEFVELAEHTGLIRPLTEHVLQTALNDAVRLGADRERISVAVNVAASSLNDADFPGMLAEIVGKTNIDPRAVVLEVTESTMMSDSPRSRRILEELDELGVELSIDDFGTGYSSLAALGSLPVDELKIDRSFVTAMASDARMTSIVRSTITLAHALGLRVVAEGVEDRATWDLLHHLNCELVQGFYIARPMSFTDFGAWMSSDGLSVEDLEVTETRVADS